MKSCPRCKRKYNDNSLHFCTRDGEPLLAGRDPGDKRTRLLNPKGRPRAKLVFASAALLLAATLWAAVFHRPAPMLRTNLLPLAPAAAAPRPPDIGEPPVVVDDAAFTLDMASHWADLDERRRKESPASKATLHADLVLRKMSDEAKFGRRVGTTSRFRPEWRSSTHQIEAREDGRKCSPEVQYSYALNFDIAKEGLDIPFNLSYDIDYWNAHNRPDGDWQVIYVGHPTERLTITLKFPRDKPYTAIYLKSGQGKDCNIKFEPENNPTYQEGVDEKTGGKVVTWTVNSPKLFWVYRVEWRW